jgi:hypothetical protein
MARWWLAVLVVLGGVSFAGAAPGDRPVGGQGAASKQGLRVSITAAETYAEGAPVTVRVIIENTGDAPIDILQRMDAFTVEVSWPAPSREGCTHRYTGTRSRRISFAQINRGQKAQQPTPLVPGKTFEVEVDLASWATAEVNGATPLGAGAFKAVAGHGKLRSKPAGFTVAGMPPAGRCKGNPGWQFWGPGR